MDPEPYRESLAIKEDPEWDLDPKLTEKSEPNLDPDP
jgi:hypothetical protein